MNYGAPINFTYSDNNVPITTEDELINLTTNIPSRLINIRDNLILNYEPVELDESTKVKLNEKKEYFKKIISEYKEVQEKYIKIEEEYLKEKRINQNNIDKINNFLKFINKIDIDEGDLNKLEEDFINIINKINNRDVLNKKLNDFNIIKKQYQYYYDIIKIINNFNVTNTCSICFESLVDSYLNPCGHTGCKKCMERSLNSGCPLCRKHISSVNKIYYI